MIKSSRQLVDEALAQVWTHPVEEAKRLHEDPGVRFVDIRDVRELEREGMIPGAIHAPRGMLEFWFDPASPYHRHELSPGPRYVLYCAAGWRSALAAKTLQDMGVPHMSHLDGGFAAWKAAGGPVGEKPSGKPAG